MNVGGSTIRIGVAAPLSGSSAVLGEEMKQAVELAVDERNRTGGILGAVLQLEVADDEGKVKNAGATARTFCEAAELLGVVGHYNSDVTLASAKLYHLCGLAVVSPVASNPQLTQGGWKNVFRFTNRDDNTAAAIAHYLYKQCGKRRAVITVTPSLYGTSIANEFGQCFLRLGGDIVAHHWVEEGQRDFQALGAGLPADFDVLFYGGSFEGASILRSMREAGRPQLFAAGDGCWDVANFLQPAAEMATEGEGVLVLSATPELGRVPGSQEFARAYTDRYGPIGNYAMNSYDSARLLLGAIECAIRTAGALPSRADVITAVRETRFRGIAYSNAVQWDAKGDNLAAVTALHVVENGRFHQVAEIGRAELAI